MPLSQDTPTPNTHSTTERQHDAERHVGFPKQADNIRGSATGAHTDENKSHGKFRPQFQSLTQQKPKTWHDSVLCEYADKNDPGLGERKSEVSSA